MGYLAIWSIVFGVASVFLSFVSQLYTDLSDRVADVLYSQGAFIYFIAAFNVLGYSMLRLSLWINTQYAPEYSLALEVNADVFGRNVAFPVAELWFTGGR